MKTIHAFFLLSLLCICACAAELSDAEWSRLKAEALARPRHLIVNDDGCDATSMPEGRKGDAADFIAFWLGHLSGTKIDTVCYCPFSVGLQMSYDTKVTERYNGALPVKGIKCIVDDLERETGKNPMMLAREFARDNGLEFFGSIRVNDTHDRFFPMLLTDFKKTHPELLCGTADNAPPRASWTSFDYGRPEVRKLLADIAAEMIRKFDVDGLELDFYRDDCFFKSFAWMQEVTRQEMDDFTEMLRAIRNDAEEYGRQRGRPVIIAMRINDSPKLCRLYGLDIERWMAEGLLDLCFSGGDHGNFAPYGDMGELCKKHNVKFYPGVDLSSINSQGVFNRNTIASFDAQSAAAYSAGADGLYFYNMFYFNYFGCAEDCYENVAGNNKTYFATLQQRWACTTLTREESKFDTLPLLSPAHNVALTPGKTFEAIIQTGEAPQKYPVKQATLYLSALGDLNAISKVEYNGTTLQRLADKDGAVSYNVPVTLLGKGPNRVRISGGSTSANGKRVILTGDKLLKMPEQLPWRRLSRGNAIAGSEQLIDGAYHIEDISDSAQTNLTYPLAGIDGAPVEIDFQMRVLPNSAPQTALLRLANGAHIEIIDFQPNQIVAVNEGVGVYDFDTTTFHNYNLRLEGDQLTLSADGKRLLQCHCTTDAMAPEHIMRGCSDSIFKRDSESLTIGSLSIGGKGGSEWKSIALSEALTLNDLALEVIMESPALEELEDAAKRDGFVIDIDFSDSPRPETLFSDYGQLERHPDGGVILDHDSGSIWKMMKMEPLVLPSWNGRYAIMRFTAEAIKPPRTAGDSSFLAVMGVPSLDGRGIYTTLMKFSPTQMETSWRKMPLDGGEHTYIMAIDRQTGDALVMVDGYTADKGRLRPEKGVAKLYWGDGSSVISGQIRLEDIKFTLRD